MKLYLLLIFLIVYSKAFSQNNCSAVIDWKHVEMIDIFNQPYGKIIRQMKNDTITENFLNVEIINQKSNHFYVSIYLAMNESEKTLGWIKKGEYIGAYKRHEEFPMDLTLHKTKQNNEKNSIVIKNWIPKLLTIEKCTGNWILVSLRQNEHKYKGWIKAMELCANAYTYCN
jgi:hypothetical protein